MIEETRRWVETIVVGWNLCPFAKPVVKADAIRYSVSVSSDPYAQLDGLDAELRIMAESSWETTLLILPGATTDFDRFNDWLAEADGLLRDRRLTGVIQLVGFHPEFRFAGDDPDDPANFTNRSPFPMVHLLRESSIEAVRKRSAVISSIPERNRLFLQAMGRLNIETILGNLKSR